MEQTQARRTPGRSPVRKMALIQGIYFLVTGIWPLVSMRSFMAVTGPKKEQWLVKTVGLLVGVLGGVLVRRGISEEDPSDDLVQVSAGSAMALGIIDVVYSAKRRISPVYLLDAVLEAVLLLGWVRAWRKSRGRETRYRSV